MMRSRGSKHCFGFGVRSCIVWFGLHGVENSFEMGVLVHRFLRGRLDIVVALKRPFEEYSTTRSAGVRV